MKFLCFFLLLLLFACEKPKKTFKDLNEQELVSLQEQLLDSMRMEMFSKTIAVNQDTTNLMTLGCDFEMRNKCTIRVNDLQQISVQQEVGAPITRTIYQFYKANKPKNDPTNNFPMYTRMDRDLILNRMKEIQKVEEKLVAEKAELEFIEYNRNQFAEWRQKLRAIELLKANELIQPHFQTSIHLHYNPKITSIKAIQDSVLRAYFQLRSEDAQTYFKKDYLELFFEDKNKLCFSRIDALKVIDPIQVVDFPNLKKYKCIVVNLFSEEPTLPPSY